MSNLVPISKDQSVSGSLKIQTMDDLSRLSKMMAISGFFDDCRDAAQAGVKILAGMEMGLGAFASLTGIHLIKGKPTIGANLMAAKVKASGKYNYRVLEHTATVCRIAFYEHKEQIGISEFTAEEARTMGTQNMNKFPKNMLFARAMSNGVRFYCPDIFLGASVYTPDELGASVDDDGNYIDVSQVQHQSVQPTVTEQIEDIPPRDFPSNLFISDAQRKRWYALTKGRYTEGGLKKLLAHFGCFNEAKEPSGKAIPLRVYDSLCMAAQDDEQATMYNAMAEQPEVEEVIDVATSSDDDFPQLELSA